MLETRLRRLPGVLRAEANPLTGNLLLCFDPRQTTQAALLAALAKRGMGAHAAGALSQGANGSPGLSPWVRAGVRGLVGHALVDAAFYALVFAEPFGLPLAALAALHLGIDTVAWGTALLPLLAGQAHGQTDGGALSTVCLTPVA
jgi:hypothetical protein